MSFPFLNLVLKYLSSFQMLSRLRIIYTSVLFYCSHVLVHSFFIILTQLGFLSNGSFPGSSFSLLFHGCHWQIIHLQPPSAVSCWMPLAGSSWGLNNTRVPEFVSLALPPSWAVRLYWIPTEKPPGGHVVVYPGHLQWGHFFIDDHGLTSGDTLKSHTPLLSISRKYLH